MKRETLLKIRGYLMRDLDSLRLTLDDVNNELGDTEGGETTLVHEATASPPPKRGKRRVSQSDDTADLPVGEAPEPDGDDDAGPSRPLTRRDPEWWTPARRAEQRKKMLALRQKGRLTRKRR